MLNNYIKLVYMNSRWYDPAIGRFISADTIVPDPTDPQAYNRYTYVRNNPIKYTDPSGHCWGVASFIRSWDVTIGGSTYGMGVNCQNIDSALAIVQNPEADPAARRYAGAYLGFWGVAGATGAAGAGLYACSLSPACAAWATNVVGTVKGCSLTNCAQQVFDSFCSSGTCNYDNRIDGADDYLNQIKSNGGFDSELVRGWFNTNGVTVHEQSAEMMGGNSGAYGFAGDGMPGWARFSDQAGRLTWLHEFIHYLQDKQGGFAPANESMRTSLELQNWQWLLNNAQTLGLTEAEITEIVNQINHYGQ